MLLSRSRLPVLEQSFDSIGDLCRALPENILTDHLRGMVDDDGGQRPVGRLIGHGPLDLIPEGSGQHSESGYTGPLQCDGVKRTARRTTASVGDTAQHEARLG